VKRAGVVRRLRDTVQVYKCTACSRTYNDPKSAKYVGQAREPLSRKEKAFQLRQEGLSYLQIGRTMGISQGRVRSLCNATNRFEISVRGCLLRDLSEMFSIARGSGPGQQSLEQFVGELVEIQIIDFRTRKISSKDLLPLGQIPTPLIPVRTHRGLLNQIEVAKARQLVESGTLNVSTAAKRFHCCSNTVARALSQTNGANGNGH
jgi:hypothetical protein